MGLSDITYNKKTRAATGSNTLKSSLASMLSPRNGVRAANGYVSSVNAFPNQTATYNMKTATTIAGTSVQVKVPTNMPNEPNANRLIDALMYVTGVVDGSHPSGYGMYNPTDDYNNNRQYSTTSGREGTLEHAAAQNDVISSNPLSHVVRRRTIIAREFYADMQAKVTYLASLHSDGVPGINHLSNTTPQMWKPEGITKGSQNDIRVGEQHGCHVQCTGFCSGSCITHCNGCTACTADCGSGCAYGCYGGCSGGCWTTTGDCGGCGGGCNTSCSGKCYDSCSGGTSF